MPRQYLSFTKTKQHLNLLIDVVLTSSQYAPKTRFVFSCAFNRRVLP